MFMVIEVLCICMYWCQYTVFYIIASFCKKLGREYGASMVAQMVKNLPSIQETRLWSLDHEGPLEKEMATHSSILAWRIPWTEEPGRLWSMGSQRIRHDWATNTVKKKDYTLFIWIWEVWYILINKMVSKCNSRGQIHSLRRYTTLILLMTVLCNTVSSVSQNETNFEYFIYTVAIPLQNTGRPLFHLHFFLPHMPSLKLLSMHTCSG